VDRTERVAGAVAAGLVALATAVWSWQLPEPGPPSEAEAIAEPLQRAPIRAEPLRPLPDAPPLTPVGEGFGEAWELPSGLGIVEQVAGLGAPARPGQVALVEFTRWASVGGRVVDSTAHEPGPTRVRLDPEAAGVMFAEGLEGMREGGQRLLLAPHGLEPGVPGTVAVVDLVSVQDPPAPPPDGLAWRPLAGFEVADPRPGSGSEIRSGSALELDYTVWAPGVAEPLDTSLERSLPLRVRFGRESLVWAPALEGLRAGGIRVVSVPPALAFPAGRRPGDLPADQPLLIEVRAHRVE
jgi:FKBP-type peptidyl-prolyl cis-trans isomerase